MGNNTQAALGAAVPNVRERHSKALYVNIPVHKEQIIHLLLPPCEADEYNGSCWVSIVIDDLDSLENWVYNGFVGTGLKGWMCKVNLLVKCRVGDEIVHGYQIMTLDFENNWGGHLKVWGARATQGVPSELAIFNNSLGTSGNACSTIMQDGDSVHIEMTDSKVTNVSISGTLSCKLLEESLLFVKFVVERPHKFLAYKGSQLAYSPESGHGSDMSTIDGTMLVIVESLTINILNRISIEPNYVDITKVIAFVQPYYIIVDHKNVFLSST